jgi:MFS family permease
MDHLGAATGPLLATAFLWFWPDQIRTLFVLSLVPGLAVFYGLTEPAEKTLVAALAGPERKGLAFGWFNFSIGVTTLPASLLFGALYQSNGPVVAFGTGAGLAVLASGLVGMVRCGADTR